MTHPDDSRLNGRHPEFARMSNRPGLGYHALHELASEMLRLNLDTSQTDVPVSLRHGSRELPLGRYLRKKLRLMIGKDEKTPQAALKKIEEEMLPVRWRARDNKKSFKVQLVEENKGKIDSLKSRTEIFKQRKSL